MKLNIIQNIYLFTYMQFLVLLFNILYYSIIKLAAAGGGRNFHGFDCRSDTFYCIKGKQLTRMA